MSTVKKVPQRQCIGCGEMKNKRELIRVLKGTDDVISIDATGRKNGRGAYICPSMACFEKAVKSRGLERSFKMAIPKEVYESLKKEMEQIDEQKKVLGLLGLAEKAGKVRSGEFSTEKAVKSGKAGLVIVSEESSDNTKKMFRNMCTYYKVPYFEFGSKEELGHILGKQMRASLAVIDENFSNALLKHFTAKA